VHQLETDELIGRVLDGDLEAYGDLITRYQAEVWRIVAAILRDRDSMEDLVQEVFIRAYHQLDRYQRGRDFGIWLKTIARNLVRNELRRRHREGQRLSGYYEGLETDWADCWRAESFQTRLESILTHCLEHLPPVAAQVVSLRYEQALEFNEIAQTMNRTVSATRQLLSRARLWLRDCVEKEVRQP
jgi:RNA polymerase sigma-70 factor (ECF subfamily)